ncbi:hypothetical protein E2C01_008605 [Portunus trituberculatus]|uniref:Uncharacterized protein n=1 Tax=Portunus trituberculatus TaxID=210409 RepID=A0A5B7D177_PORTR|nr:hypothetical protein [Portunus trituberculatus]
MRVKFVFEVFVYFVLNSFRAETHFDVQFWLSLISMYVSKCTSHRTPYQTIIGSSDRNDMI